MKIIWFLILIMVVTVAGFLFLIQKKPASVFNPNTSEPTITNTQPTPDTSDLQAGGSSYRDPQGMYVILYPSDYQLDDQSSNTLLRIYKTGPTQGGQTEMYDGAIITFETINLQGQTLSDWVDTSIKNGTADGTTELVEPKKSITHNNYPGFTYTMRGLGEAKYLVLQKDAQSDYALHITTFVEDPQNLGFQQEVDKTLATLQILK